MPGPETALMLIIPCAVAGAMVGAVLSCVPGLHVYNVMGLLLLAAHQLGPRSSLLCPEVVLAATAGLVVGYAVLSIVPSVLLSAPDESAVLTVMPGQKYLQQGRGQHAVWLVVAGGLVGALFILAVAPVLPLCLPRVREVLRPHGHWVLWCVIAFLLLSEWPKEGYAGSGGLRRLAESWRVPGMGVLTFLLSGLLGFILLYRSPIPARAAFQNLMPAFVGLFAVPHLLINAFVGGHSPEQTAYGLPALTRRTLAGGALAGIGGGAFAAFFPVVTGGIGGLLAGHATSVRDDDTFLVSQGAARFVYYVGALVLFCVPGVHLTRGGAAWLLSGLLTPETTYEYYVVLAAVAMAASAVLLTVGPLTRAVLSLLARYGCRRMAGLGLCSSCGLVLALTGPAGLLVTVLGASIGLLPILYRTRRTHCLGILLLPMACGMSGVGPTVAAWLGL